MYSLSALKRGLENPRLVLAELNRLYNNGLWYRASNSYNQTGVDVLAEDWDVLIILDACRYDAFEEVATDLPGPLNKVESQGATTNEFLRANFAGETLHDTVYITANPQLYRIENGIYDAEPLDVTFHDLIDIWQGGWDDDHRTVMPEVVTKAAREAADRYPQKRLVIHFMQPHAPFIGSTGIEHFPTRYLNFWSEFRRGTFDVSRGVLRQAYMENLEIVVPHVAELVSEIKGRTVVTADHGELLGDKDRPIPIRRYGHPASTYHPALVEVPWHEHDSGVRRNVVAESPTSRSERESVPLEGIRSRLRDLGYTA